MRRYLLDTGPLGAYLQGRLPAVDLIVPWIRRGEAATSILVYGEIIEYIKSLQDYPAKYLGLRSLLGAVYPYFLTYAIMERYAQIRRTLRPPHGTGLIGDIDTLIVRRDTRTYIPQQLGKNLKGGSWATHLTWS